MAKQIDINGLAEFKKKCDETYAKVGQGGGSSEIVDLTPYIVAGSSVDSVTFTQEGIGKMKEASIIKYTLDSEGTVFTFVFYTFKVVFGGEKITYLMSTSFSNELFIMKPGNNALTYTLEVTPIPASLSATDSNCIQLVDTSQSELGSRIYFNRINGYSVIGDTSSRNIELFPQPPKDGKTYVLKSINGVLRWVQE